MQQRWLRALLAGSFLLALASAQDDSSEDPLEVPKEDAKQPDDVCFGVLGCFSMGHPWWSDSRPVPQPDTPQNIGTRFYLFTRKQPRRTLVVTNPTIRLKDVDFNNKRPVIFITHGLSSNSNTTWMIDMKDALLEKIDGNVFLTDWGPGASGVIKYMNAVSNTRVVGAEISRLIDHMMRQYQILPRNIHLIGHSLGAHISAYTGKNIKNIGRLTALDPAQPAFEGHDVQVRLDSSDATFVEVIHTDALPTIPTFGLGMIGEYGHIDYYINGGFMQPGCSTSKDLPPLNTFINFLQLSISVIENIVSCSHGRASLVYTEAIRHTNCTFWGHPGNVEEKVLGVISKGFLHRYLTPSNAACDATTCSPMNLDNIKYRARGSFVVPTASQSPYCIHEAELDRLVSTEARHMVRGAAKGVIGALLS